MYSLFFFFFCCKVPVPFCLHFPNKSFVFFFLVLSIRHTLSWNIFTLDMPVIDEEHCNFSATVSQFLPVGRGELHGWNPSRASSPALRGLHPTGEILTSHPLSCGYRNPRSVARACTSQTFSLEQVYSRAVSPGSVFCIVIPVTPALQFSML